MTTITDTQAMDALESLDDYARMDIGVAPTGPYRTLRKFILQHATTVGLADMTRAALEKASAQPAAQKAEPVAKREVLIPYGWTLTPDNLQSVWPENVSCVIEGTLSSVRTTGAREHQTISQLDAQLDHFMKMAGIEGWQAWQMRAFMDAARTQSAEEVESVAPITPLALAQGALIHAISRSASGAANAGDLRRAIRALFGDEVDAKLASFLLTT